MYFQVIQLLGISHMHHEEEAQPKPTAQAPALGVYRLQES